MILQCTPHTGVPHIRQLCASSIVEPARTGRACSFHLPNLVKWFEPAPLRELAPTFQTQLSPCPARFNVDTLWSVVACMVPYPNRHAILSQSCWRMRFVRYYHRTLPLCLSPREMASKQTRCCMIHHRPLPNLSSSRKLIFLLENRCPPSQHCSVLVGCAPDRLMRRRLAN